MVHIPRDFQGVLTFHMPPEKIRILGELGKHTTMFSESQEKCQYLVGYFAEWNTLGKVDVDEVSCLGGYTVTTMVQFVDETSAD
jgi:hypothetical protein